MAGTVKYGAGGWFWVSYLHLAGWSRLNLPATLFHRGVAEYEM